MVCATSKASDHPAHTCSLIRAFASRLIVKLMTEHNLEFVSLKGGCIGLSEVALVKMSNCWISHAVVYNLIGDMFKITKICCFTDCFTKVPVLCNRSPKG